MRIRRSLVLAGLAALVAAPVAAHHGWGSYDAAGPITITGAMTHVAYAYPHVHVMVEYQGKPWEITLAPPSRMQARGAVEAVVQAGRTVSAFGYPNKSAAAEMRAERITIDGKTYEMR
jgi:hypothetical protein